MPESKKDFMISKSVQQKRSESQQQCANNLKKYPKQIKKKKKKTECGEVSGFFSKKQSNSRRKASASKSQRGSNSVIPIVMLMQSHESHSAGCRDVTLSNSPAPPTQSREKCWHNCGRNNFVAVNVANMVVCASHVSW